MAPLLRITQRRGTGPDHHQAVLTLADEGWAPRLVTVEFRFALSDQDREDVRWYLEDYLEFADDPAPRIAARIEKRMEAIGEELFHALFQGSEDARELWAALRPRLGEARIEVVAGVGAATAIPWELLRDPRTGARAALEARAFVRGPQPNAVPAQAPAEPTKDEKFRILLAICRPKGGEDVPFRSVAGLLAKGLTGGARDAFELHVLRPPTFDQLAKVLRRAKDEGAPYHTLHFDGHGTYANPAALEAGGLSVLGELRLDASGGGSAGGRRGLLVFEDPDKKSNVAFVDGVQLGGLLRETGVPVLILNACQSAFAEAPSQPARVEADGAARETVEAYGSLAQAVLDAGTAGVVAMRYAVYVVTAAQFVAELYEALARGRTLGEAVSLARKHLSEKPERTVAFEPRLLQDWSVPVVWERQPLRLWPEATAVSPKLVIDPNASGDGGAFDAELPARPDIGFYGRDETLYALDRGLDANRIVLLHAYAGAGKTATAAEFGRWYRATGGVQGPVLFSTFERHLPLVRVLDKIGQMFADDLAGAGIQWDAIIDLAARRRVALQVLAQIPVLWIWDNVEPVTGFPAGAVSEWSALERSELVDFLRDATAPGMQAKFLLTSRREEREWLGELATRVRVPPMPMRERLQLAHALAGRRGLRPAKLPDLRPLLRFTDGNPLTILVTVSEALREGIDTPTRLEELVERLRTGAQEFAEEAETAEARDKSLGASLSYGFRNAFSEQERQALSLLHLFRGFVDADALCGMSNPKADWYVEPVRGWTREQWLALLDRADQVGLLTARDGGYYSIHPALPWFFRGLYEYHHPGADADRARRAFTYAIGEIASYWHDRYGGGDRGVLGQLVADEGNLRAAWALAREHGLWDSVISSMQGLQTLYGATGRRATWRRLVEAVVPDLVDPTTDGPLPGREAQWEFVTGYRVELMIADRNWSEAERLQRLSVEWRRSAAAPVLSANPENWDAAQRLRVRNFAVSLEALARIRRMQQNGECISYLHEALELFRRLGARQEEAAAAFQLGQAYLLVVEARDLEGAERWYRRSLDLRAPGDNFAAANCLGQLGGVALRRFDEARNASRPDAELLVHLNTAAQHYRQALDLLPDTAVNELDVAHHQLGAIYYHAGDVDRALYHYQHSIRYTEASGDLYSAGQSRHSVALMLFEAGRLPDARAYAEASLANYRQFGDRAANELRKLEALLAQIDAEITKEDRS